MREMFIKKGIGKTGNPYYQLHIIFESGYEFVQFLSGDQAFALMASKVKVVE